jgi:hypothetical protein
MTISAVYRNGYFVSSQPVDLAEGAEVQIVLPDQPSLHHPGHRPAVGAMGTSPTQSVSILEARFAGSIGTLSGTAADELMSAIQEDKWV